MTSGRFGNRHRFAARALAFDSATSYQYCTEGSYLLPDMRWGYRYLQAVRNVFGPGGQP